MTDIASTTVRLDVLPAGRYRLDPTRSTVTFRTRHLFGLGSVTGTMDVAHGEVVVDDVAGTTLAVTLDAASFASGHARRDGDVRSAKFLAADDHPELVFRAGPFEQAGARWAQPGELTVRGATAPATLAVESVRATDGGFTARATTRIDRYALGVTAAKGMAARYLDVDLDVTATAVR